MRNWLNERPVVAAGVLAIGILAIVATAVHMLRPPSLPQPGRVYYMDLQTGELFAAGNAPTPPVSPKGNPSALAHAYSCTSCDDQAAIKMAYVERSLPPDQIIDELESVEVSLEGRDWVLQSTPAGQRIAALPTCPDGLAARRCRP
jgi:hypothetical protein